MGSIFAAIELINADDQSLARRHSIGEEETVCNAMVIPGDNEPLLGVIPLEDLDVVLLPLGQEMKVNPEHPYYAQMKLK